MMIHSSTRLAPRERALSVISENEETASSTQPLANGKVAYNGDTILRQPPSRFDTLLSVALGPLAVASEAQPPGVRFNSRSMRLMRSVGTSTHREELLALCRSVRLIRRDPQSLAAASVQEILGNAIDELRTPRHSNAAASDLVLGLIDARNMGIGSLMPAQQHILYVRAMSIVKSARRPGVTRDARLTGAAIAHELLRAVVLEHWDPPPHCVKTLSVDLLESLQNPREPLPLRLQKVTWYFLTLRRLPLSYDRTQADQFVEHAFALSADARITADHRAEQAIIVLDALEHCGHEFSAQQCANATAHFTRLLSEPRISAATKPGLAAHIMTNLLAPVYNATARV